MLTLTEENYIKIIYHLGEMSNKEISTNAIAEVANTAAATVTDMLKRLAEKKLVKHEKYKGVKLTKTGNEAALMVIRKHRLWETFLVNVLGFNWNEVHSIAEQLEHIQSEELINRLDKFLGKPKFDPHGDPIPSKDGTITKLNVLPLSVAALQKYYTVVAVTNQQSEFLTLLDKYKISIGNKIMISNVNKFDQSVEIKIGNKSIMLSELVSKNILVN